MRDQKGRRYGAYRMVLDTGRLGEFYGIQGLTWRNPPILSKPTGQQTVNGRRLVLYADGNRLRFVAYHTRRAVYWVSNTLVLGLTNRQMLAIARPCGPRPLSLAAEREPLGVIGVGWVGLVTAACFAELGHEVCARDIDAERRSRRCGRGEVPIHEPGPRRAGRRRNARAAALHDRHGRGARARRGCCSSASDTPPTYSGDADLSRVGAVVDAMPGGRATTRW